MLPFKILRLPYYQDFIVRRNHNLQCSNNVQEGRRRYIPQCRFKERPSIVMMHMKWGYAILWTNRGPYFTAIYVRWVGSNTSFVRICVWGQTEIGRADLSILSENASFNDFAHSRAQGRSWESQPLEIVVSIPLPSLLYNTLICSEQNR